MTARALIAHLVFAALALAFAWQRGHAVEAKKGGPSSTTLLDAKRGDVVSLVYTWPKGTSRVSSKGAETSRAVVVDLDRELEKKDDKKDDQKKDDAKKDEKVDAGPSDKVADEVPMPAPAEREQARFPGGKSVVTSLEAFEPLKTRRTLGAVDGERLKAMGLESPERSLVVTTSQGNTLTLEIGESAYGGQGRYARVKGESVVHLLEPTVVTGLEGGPDALMEKRIIAANVEEIVGFAARSGEKEKAFVHVDRDQSAKRRFAPKDDPASTAEEPGKAMTSLRNLRAQKLLADASMAGSAVAAFQVQVEGREQPIVVELLERVDGAGHLARTGGWVFEISETQAKELLGDVDAAL